MSRKWNRRRHFKRSGAQMAAWDRSLRGERWGGHRWTAMLRAWSRAMGASAK